MLYRVQVLSDLNEGIPIVNSKKDESYEHLYYWTLFTYERRIHSAFNSAGIETLVDVRAYPGSRKFPWFANDKMAERLPEAGINYTHIEELGGRRQPSQLISPALNDGWDNQSFHNYADYTLSDCFQVAVKKLTEIASEKQGRIAARNDILHAATD